MELLFIFLLWKFVGKGLYRALLHSGDTYRPDR